MLVTQSCLTLTLCDNTDCSPQSSSVHGILQARILEWIVIPFSKGSSWPRDQTQVSCIAGRFFTIWATREAQFEGNLAFISPFFFFPASPPSWTLITFMFDHLLLSHKSQRLCLSFSKSFFLLYPVFIVSYIYSFKFPDPPSHVLNYY